MKIYLNGILVVEGKEDVAYLSNYISSEIVAINGFEIANETINYLKGKKVIVMVDPDDAGQTIRKRLNELLPNASNVEIDIDKCVRGSKNGIAECQIDEILCKLKPYMSKNPAKPHRITGSDLYSFGLTNGEKELREYVCKQLNLGRCNGKKLMKRLYECDITMEQLADVVKQYKHGN